MADGYMTIPENSDYFRNWQASRLGGSSNSGTGASGSSGFSYFDQYQDLINRIPGFSLTRGDGGIQTSVQGTPVTQFGRPITEAPIFADVLSQLYNPISAPDLSNAGRTVAGRDMLERGLATLNAGGGTSPEIQAVMDRIASLRSTAEGSAASRAQALATKRGIGGSSIEQFGVGSAVSEAGRPYTEQEANVLLQEAARQSQLRDKAADALFGRANTEATTSASLATSFGEMDATRRGLIASMTSDELASLRNLDEAGQNRALQEKLGILGINAQIEANETAADASKKANNPFNIVLGGIGQGVGSRF